jgi:hypothetical protein
MEKEGLKNLQLGLERPNRLPTSKIYLKKLLEKKQAM